MPKKKPDFYKARFVVKVEDTAIYGKYNGIEALKTKTNFSGISCVIEQVEGYIDVFRITSRAHFLKYALKDYSFLMNVLQRNFGQLMEAYLMGRIMKRNQETWVYFEIPEFFSEGEPIIKQVDTWDISPVVLDR